ncbi:hypothetical protein SAY86_003688 [Trapa natans]|uniref:YLP motif-containing protein 1 n=1 Tax=Trapa natans TaxID=22666 RepID=A0AAN7N299_TRANT|nr:hypothetical protein SAY86_003688 [Trapa natans]
MDHQWRQRPVQSSICPVCSVPHFPFCPRPPTFGPNPSFTPPPGHQRPGFDPFSPRAWRDPANGIGDPRNWHGYPIPGLEPYGQMPIRPQGENFLPVPHPGGTNGFVGDSERNSKRMRVDTWVLSEDERRLKLIRDHGRGISGYAPEVDMLAGHATSAGAKLAIGEKEISRFGIDAKTSLQSTDISPNYGSWSENPGNKPLNYEHSSGMSPMHPQRAPFLGSNGKRSFDGTPDLFGCRYLPGTTQYAAPSLKIHCSPPPPPPPMISSSLFPVPVSSSGIPPYYPPAPENFTVQSYHHYNKQPPDVPNGFVPEKFPPQRPKVVDASQIFKPPGRATRPDHFVIILRGLPGSGKSYLAKMLRDIEVENGGAAPRIYSMDEYFMTEVEKVETVDASKSSGTVRGKRTATRKVMEYFYEPEMEEAYRASMLKAYNKTVEEGAFTFIIVDDRNLRVADFAQFWANGKKSGYEVYILEAAYKDPEGCAARNVHGFTLDDIQVMVGKWEEAPSLYLQLDVKSLFHGDDLKESGIQEVEMDMEDENDQSPSATGAMPEKAKEPPLGDDGAPSEDHHKDGERWDAEGDHSEVVRDLGQSKWSEGHGEYDTEGARDIKGSFLIPPISVPAYGRKKRKSVRWGDKVGDTGFSIMAAKISNSSSLVIGPGAGYNLKSNPLPKEESTVSTHSPLEPKRQRIFEEQMKAERESFKAVFDHRRHRIGGMQPDEE